MKKILYIFIISLTILSCNETSNSNSEINSIKTVEISKEITVPISTTDSFKDWWNFKFNSLPSYSHYEYLKDLDFDTLVKYYKILSIEFFNEKGSGRYSEISEKLAEKMNVRKEIFNQLNNYFGLDYYKYLGEITKEYFEANKIGILPDYYTPISSTVFIGEHTFNCDIIINKSKDDPEFQNEVNNLISYLKINLPERIQGFRILSVKYKNGTTGTSGSMNMGYLWRRHDNLLLEMQEGKGTYGKQLPENTLHWQQDSWNDGKKKINNYEI